MAINSKYNLSILHYNSKKNATVEAGEEINNETRFFYFKYNDGQYNFNVKSLVCSIAFRELCLELEKIGIKMLVKGCCIDMRMVKFLQNTLLTMKLELGKRVDYKTPTVNIFTPEKDIKKIGTLEEQDIYYDQWLESIQGLPY